MYAVVYAVPSGRIDSDIEYPPSGPLSYDVSRWLDAHFCLSLERQEIAVGFLKSVRSCGVLPNFVR